MAKSTRPQPHLDLSGTRNQTTTWIGLNCGQVEAQVNMMRGAHFSPYANIYKSI